MHLANLGAGLFPHGHVIQIQHRLGTLHCPFRPHLWHWCNQTATEYKRIACTFAVKVISEEYFRDGWVWQIKNSWTSPSIHHNTRERGRMVVCAECCHALSMHLLVERTLLLCTHAHLSLWERDKLCLLDKTLKNTQGSSWVEPRR